ncbi:unnamed protein product [Angiostrongylus costaricensis]|uniref:Transmembrane protein n=1 Tax=Angiostrongylus costaricensis TaxID=334426 RepID=A0A0R3PJW1_ANGCS|nr:unnamed protein product [Angiostrongylus costaricensis]
MSNKECLERNQSTIEKFSSIPPMLGFYVTIFLVWIMIGLSWLDVIFFTRYLQSIARSTERALSLEYVGGWGMSTICRPLFDDPTFSIYSSLIRTVDLPEEYSVNVSIEQHGIAPLKDKLAATVNSLKQQMTQYMKEPTKIQERLDDYLISSLGFRKDITSTLLSECVSVDSDATRETVQHLESLSGSLEGLSSDIKGLNNSLAVDPTLKNEEVIEKITNLHTRASDLIEMVLINASDQYTHELTANIFPCRSLYDVYEYAGFVLCKTISDPVQGMWAAAGALFTVLASRILR